MPKLPLLPLLFALFALAPPPAAAAPTEATDYDEIHAGAMRAEEAKPGKKHVLVINSYSQGYAWTDEEVRGIEERLAGDRNLVLHIEYMDTKMINDARYFDLLAEVFEHKYQQLRFDVLLTTDDDALRFVHRYRDRLFPGVPLVFAGVNNFDDAKAAGLANYTGVNEAADFPSNLALIVRLYPHTRNVYVINDTLTSGLSLRDELDRAAAGYRDRLRFHYLVDLSMAELKERLARLPENSVVFYLSFFRDATGATFTPWEAIPPISAAAKAPLFGAVDYMLGKGIVGGMLKSSYFQGETAARLARRVLDGTPAEAIPVVMESPNRFMFDYRQLTRFGIDPGSLPEGSQLINEPQTFYYRYKEIIWATLSLFAFLLIFIVVLLFNIQKRKRAQRGLQQILESMSSLFEFHSLERFKNDMRRKLSGFLPMNERSEPLALYRYVAAEGGRLEEARVTALEESGGGAIPGEREQLIRESLAENQCVVKKRHGVALFKSTNIPGNLIYFEGLRDFDAMDRDLLEIFTNNVSMAIENLEKHKIEESLETARKIQLSMLPQSFSALRERFRVDLHARLIAAKEVGGDLYDCFAVDEHHLGFTVGDVSGKGVPAALFMAMAKTLVRSAAEGNLDPARVLEKVNTELARDNDQAMFVTLFFAILDRDSGELRFANGGHNPPYLHHLDGSVERLAVKPGIALGVMEEIPFETQQITLAPGEAILVYSDGVTEAMDPADAEFTEARLRDFLAARGGGEAERVTAELIETVERFAGGAAQSDDITVMYLRNGAAS
ncbi:SpoIIE family protein phosphatase [Endothiovibrio diazotrophicus]